MRAGGGTRHERGPGECAAAAGFDAPRGLEAFELVLEEHAFVLFEWPAGDVVLDDSLTGAERDVLRGILQGESNAAIARRRGSRPRTIANQVASIFRKLSVQSRSELVARAVRGHAKG
jgi:DNA-binding NarL/FixJ family response regulator